MRKSILNLLLLVAFLLGNILVVPAEEFDWAKTFDHMKYHNTGADLFEGGQYNKALYFLDKAIEIDPNSTLSYEVRAKVYCKLKQYNKAWDDVKKAQSLGTKVQIWDGRKLQSKAYEVDPVFLEELRRASGREY